MSVRGAEIGSLARRFVKLSLHRHAIWRSGQWRICVTTVLRVWPKIGRTAFPMEV